MSISPEFLAILRCPDDRSTLEPADAATLTRLNGQVADKTLRNRGGELVARPLEGGLVRADRKLLYPIVDGIPVLLVDEAIALESVDIPASN